MKYIDIMYTFMIIWRVEKIHTSQNPADTLMKVVIVKKLKPCLAYSIQFVIFDLEYVQI